MKFMNLFICIAIALGLSGCSSKKEPLHLYSWAYYIKPELIDRFEQEFNCKVIIDTYDANESMYAKFKAGASGYDLIIPTSYFVELMAKQGLLQPIQAKLIPNLHFIDREHPIFHHQLDLSYSVPYMLGYTGIAYRKDRVKNIEASWNVFARKDLTHRMTMVNDIRDGLGAALKYLGYSYNTIDPHQLEEAAQLVVSWKNNLAKFDNEQYKNGIASSEYLVCQGYSGDIVQVMNENPNIGFILPKEGTHVSCDYFVIPKEAKHSKLAHSFINFLLDPEVATENMLFLCYICPNTGVYAKLPEEIINNPAFFPPKEILDKSESVYDLAEEVSVYHRAWDYVKENY